MNFNTFVVATIATLAAAVPVTEPSDVGKFEKRWSWIDWRMFEPID